MALSVMPFSGSSATLSFDWHPNPLVLAENFYRGALFLEDMKPPLTLSREEAVASMRRRFETKTTAGGQAWAPWSDSYEPYAIAFGGTLLDRTGAMKAAATSREAFLITPHEIFFSGAGLPEYWIWAHDGTGPKHASNKSLMKYFEESGKKPKKGTTFGSQPARPFTGIDDEAQFAIADIFDIWVSEAAQIILFGSGPRKGQAQFTKNGKFWKAPV